MTITTRTPAPSDFRSVHDDEHTFDFFEDEQGNGLYALGTITDEEFLRQANVHDQLTDDAHEPWTAEHLERHSAVIEDTTDRRGNPYSGVKIVPEGTALSAEIAVLSR